MICELVVVLGVQWYYFGSLRSNRVKIPILLSYVIAMVFEFLDIDGADSMAFPFGSVKQGNFQRNHSIPPLIHYISHYLLRMLNNRELQVRGKKRKVWNSESSTI